VAGPPHKQKKKGIRLAATAEICATLSSVILGLPSPTKKQKGAAFALTCPTHCDTLQKCCRLSARRRLFRGRKRGAIGLGWAGLGGGKGIEG